MVLNSTLGFSSSYSSSHNVNVVYVIVESSSVQLSVAAESLSVSKHNSPLEEPNTLLGMPLPAQAFRCLPSPVQVLLKRKEVTVRESSTSLWS